MCVVTTMQDKNKRTMGMASTSHVTLASNRFQRLKQDPCPVHTEGSSVDAVAKPNVILRQENEHIRIDEHGRPREFFFENLFSTKHFEMPNRGGRGLRMGDLYTRSLATDDKCYATSALYALRTSLPFFSRALRACLTD